jgi:Fic family protein
MAKKPVKAWKPESPYNELPPLPPSAPLQTPAVLKATIRARAALAELDRLAGKLPNPGILVRTLPLMEARCSSEIENIVTTDDMLFRRADLPNESTPPAVREASRHAEALLEAYHGLRKLPVCSRLAQQICSRIKGHPMSVRRLPGTVIASSKQVMYTPPVGESVIRGLLANWETYLHSDDDTDPLIRMAVAHYQFEAIHPFTDGNGRTGRILNSLYLTEAGLLEQPILYLSRYILANRSDYYRLLNAVTSHEAWEEWVLYILQGVVEVATWTSGKVRQIHALVESTQKQIVRKCPGLPLDEVMRAIFEQPYCRIRHLVEARVAKRETASLYLVQLTKAGVLTEIKQGRDKLFLNHRLVDLLTDPEG